MYKALKPVLDVQERDVKMIRLMRLKKERQKELLNIRSIRQDLQRQMSAKEEEILAIKKQIRLSEVEVQEVAEKVSKLESQQGAVKKIDEFNALSKEISTAEKAKAQKEQEVLTLQEQQANEEEVLENLKETLASTTESTQAYEEEIRVAIESINEEGKALQEEREKLAGAIDSEVLSIYERLLSNKKDRVVVPLENRTCSGCHIVLTAQHENSVRKGDRLIFCEHCSRIHYWQESELLEGTSETSDTKRRRRRTSVTA